MAAAPLYFGTDGIRGSVGGPVINAEFALRLGYATGKVLARNRSGDTRPTVLIGKDTRVSGYMLESALEAGFSAAGVDVLLAGPMPTPAIAYLTRAWRLTAGIVISASHNPYFDNGIKFFSSQGRKLASDVERQIEEALSQPVGCVASESLGRARRLNDAPGRYIEFCKSTFPNELDLTGLVIVVDGAHGAAYHIAPSVLEELGARVIAIGCKPDGLNINHDVGTTHIQTLVTAVRANQAHLGIALDGDADRVLMVDAAGRAYNGDELLYAIVLDRLAKGPLSGVAGTLMTNFAFEQRMQELGIPFARAGVGDRYVMELLKERGWLYGGEASGHLICLDKQTTGDGMVAALQVLAFMQRTQSSLPQLLSSLQLYPQQLVNVPLSPGQDWQAHAGLAKALRGVQAQLGNTGRVLVRASGTEPKLRLMVEAANETLVRQCLDTLVHSLE
jgi:phosphoglucosamine mutase